ncbi:MAG: phytoene desaturase [Cyclobacteriaceae bacterium]|nr:phytoene desaturase [Cyclobacteriaceae bacterium]MCH8516559.1 phytoene desaturase [Cyclobacteriaceae bacterium]
MSNKKVVIIGAGIAGLASAVRMAVRGYEVEVLEGNAFPGGKLSEFRLRNYRFDAGPSLFTMPEYVKELFDLAGKPMEKYFAYDRLAVNCHYFYEDGTFIKAYADIDRFIQEVHDKTGEPVENLEKALKKSEELYRYLSPVFMERSVHKASTFLNKDALKAYSKIHRFDFFRTMDEANRAAFDDDRVVQLFNRYATYNGSNPYQAPATLNIIPSLEFHKGAYFPRRGMYSITLAIFNLAKDLGVKFHFNQKVDRIIHKGGRAIGVATDRAEIAADIIINNRDVVNTYKDLLPDVKAPKRLVSQEKSSSALIFYWGMKKSFEQLDLHNIFFTKDYEKEFAAIFSGTLYEDPTVYVNISSKYEPADAPIGCENWFTMINVPNNSGQDWAELVKQARQMIIDKLSRMLDFPIGGLIEVEEVLDPIRIESRTSSAQGSLYGNSSNNKFAAFLRHSNRSSKIKNLYFCGGSVHPGGGIPLSLLSAKLVDDWVK